MSIAIEYKDALLRRLSMLRGPDGDQAEQDAISALLQASEGEGR